MANKLTCIVCGRKFPKGQGVVIELGKTTLTFHSTRCATKFFKLLIERIEDKDLIEKTAKELIHELEEIRKRKEELYKKKI